MTNAGNEYYDTNIQPAQDGTKVTAMKKIVHLYLTILLLCGSASLEVLLGDKCHCAVKLQTAGQSRRQISRDLSVRPGRFSTNISLHEIEQWYYMEADRQAGEGKWKEALVLLEQINLGSFRAQSFASEETDLLLKGSVLYVKALYELERYDTLISHVDNLNDELLVHIHEYLIEYYVLSAIELQRFDKISSILDFRRRVDKQPPDELYKQIIYSLLVKEDYEAVSKLTEIFPANIYVEGEKNYILGVVHFHLGLYSQSSDFFHAVDPHSIFKQPSQNYLSLIYYYLNDTEDIPGEIDNLTDEIKFNHALNLLKAGEIDQANAIALMLEPGDKKQLLKLFVAWETGHYLTVYSLLDAFDKKNFSEHSLLSLIAAEASYHTGRYRQAKSMYKHYLGSEGVDLQYANHAIGYSFKGYYRYNNTAYYWIKNLEPTKSFYDSLAAYNLSLLYTHTENYGSAAYYFRYYLERYEMPTEDEDFINSYLLTLKGLNEPEKYRHIFDEYANLLPLGKRHDGLLYLGYHYAESDKPQQALHYLQQALNIKDDDQLVLDIERIRFSKGQYKDSEDFILSLIAKNPGRSFTDKLSLDLTRFYISQKRYAAAGNFIDSLLVSHAGPRTAYDDDHGEEKDIYAYGEKEKLNGGLYPQRMNYYLEKHGNAYVDSLQYLRGVVFRETEGKDKALQYFIDLNRRTDNQGLRVLIKQQLNGLFDKMEPRKAVTFLDELIEKEENFQLSDQYLLLLAGIYEKESLYEEANKIYRILWEETPETDAERALQAKPELYHRAAINEIRLHNYRKALDYLYILKDISPEISEDILFLSYLAHYSLDDKEKAVKILLDLYYEYPQSPKRFEFIKNIIELFVENDNYLFAWYILKDYYDEATKTEQWALERYREQIVPQLDADTTSFMEIDNFRKVVIDSLFNRKEEPHDNLIDEKEDD